MTMTTGWPAASPAGDEEPEAAAAGAVDDAAFVLPAAIRARASWTGRATATTYGTSAHSCPAPRR